MYKNNQSIFNNLINLFPNFIKNKEKDYVSPSVSADLFRIWKKAIKVNENTYKRPITCSTFDVEKMKNAGLIKSIGENIEITKKGQNIIKVMILGDDRSIFEDTEIIIDYNTALTNTKNVKTAKNKKIANSSMETQMKNEAITLKVKYDGTMKDGKGNIRLYAFTDPKTRSSFTVNPGGSVSNALDGIRKRFGI